MDAISDVSRASQIFSSLPSRPPLPDPLDLDELFGFNEVLKKESNEEVVDLEYFDKNRVFINHVDSFIGKYIVSALTRKHPEGLKPSGSEVEEDNQIETVEIKIEENSEKRGKKKKEKTESESKGKKAKSPKSTKSLKEKEKLNLQKELFSPLKDTPLEEVEVIDDFVEEKGLAYDTSRLTVAEYYEMLELEPGLDREEFLKQKLSKYTENLKISTVFEQVSPGTFLKMSLRENKKSTDFTIIGTLKNNEAPKDYVQEGVSEIIQISQKNNDFMSELVKCGVFLYIVNEDLDQVMEATWVINCEVTFLDNATIQLIVRHANSGTFSFLVHFHDKRFVQDSQFTFFVLDRDQPYSTLVNFIQEIKEKEERQFSLPVLILISSFMTWSLTKSLTAQEPELPFTEKDYRKRKPHPNYQLLYELEERVLKVKSNQEMDAIILVCGIPYGHEEGVLSNWFEMAYHNSTLPVYGRGSNVIPITHVDNLGLIVREVLDKRYALDKPFILAKDLISYTMKDLVQAISSKLGSGCCRIMPEPFAFLEDEVTQVIYDQLTANVYMESYYPLFKEEDIKWNYETGFVKNINYIVKEFMDAEKPKPIHIIFYSSNKEMKNIALKLSEHFYTPYLHVGIVLREYIIEMLEKIEKLQNNVSIKTSVKIETDLDGFCFIQEVEACQEYVNLENEINFFRKLNIKDIDDVEKLTDIEKISILKRRLKMNTCVYRGYILDSFPEFLKQAELLFAEDVKLVLENDIFGGHSFLPDYVVYLETLKRQVSEIKITEDEKTDKNKGNEKKTSSDLGTRLNETIYKIETVVEDDIEEIMTEENNKSEKNKINQNEEIQEDKVEGVLRNEYTELKKEVSVEDFTGIVVDYLLMKNEKCKLIQYAVDKLENPDKIFKSILKVIEEDNLMDASSHSSKMQLNKGFPEMSETTISALKEQEESAEDTHDTLHEIQLLKLKVDPSISFGVKETLERQKETEEDVLAIRSYPLLSYLISFVYPTLTNAILEVTALRPKDPLDFLAEYLFKNNPDGRMYDPSQLKSEEDLRNRKSRFPKVDSKACFA